MPNEFCQSSDTCNQRQINTDVWPVLIYKLWYVHQPQHHRSQCLVYINEDGNIFWQTFYNSISMHLDNMYDCFRSIAYYWTSHDDDSSADRFAPFWSTPWYLCHIFFVKPSWWRHQMETFSALLALCAGNSPVTGEFPSQRPVTQSFDVSFGLRLNKRLSKQSWGWWFETPSCSLWRHCYVESGRGKWHDKGFSRWMKTS